MRSLGQPPNPDRSIGGKETSADGKKAFCWQFNTQTSRTPCTRDHQCSKQCAKETPPSKPSKKRLVSDSSQLNMHDTRRVKAKHRSAPSQSIRSWMTPLDEPMADAPSQLQQTDIMNAYHQMPIQPDTPTPIGDREPRWAIGKKYPYGMKETDGYGPVLQEELPEDATEKDDNSFAASAMEAACRYGDPDIS